MKMTNNSMLKNTNKFFFNYEIKMNLKFKKRQKKTHMW